MSASCAVVMYAAEQHNIVERNRLHVEHGQLLLEHSTLLMQASTQDYAESKLGMVIPNHESTVIIRE